MSPTNSIEQLIQLLSRLPGVGSRSARRMALHLIRNREHLMLPLADQLRKTAAELVFCPQCGMLDSTSPCHICADTRRDAACLCVVEDIADVWAIERSRMYRGQYHVLGGTLSAMDGRGPDQLNLKSLLPRVKEQSVQEVILATNVTVDGQTTAHYITDMLGGTGVRVTRLAQGIPMGGELDYLDEGTLGAAFHSRALVS